MRFLSLKSFLSSAILSLGLLLTSVVIGQTHSESMQPLENPFSESYLKDHIKSSKPRMVFNEEIVLNLKNKVRTDPVIGNVYQAVRINAFALLDQPVLERIQIGRRLLSVSREMLERINLLGVVYLVEEDQKILDRIDQEIVAVCEFTDWNPSHYLDVAEMSLAVALGLDWTMDRLPEKSISLAREALIEKGIKPGWAEYGGQDYWWIKTNNNWNQVCHGGMIAAAIAIAEEDPKLAAQTIKRALDNIPRALSEYIPDGVYPEGPGYWTYGTSYSVVTAAMLETAFGTDFGHQNYPGFMESALFKVMCNSPMDLYYNFADCGDRGSRYGDNILAWFATKTGISNYFEKEKFMMPAEDMKIDRFSGAALAWMSQYQEKGSTQIPNAWFGRSTNPIAVFKDPEGKRGYYFGAKGGRGTLNHGNMDGGSFIFELDGVRWVIDPGVQPYNELEETGFNLWSNCQDCDRWKLLTKNNFGHSTITINKQLHIAEGNSEMLGFEGGQHAEVTFDLGPAFGDLVTKAQRRFVKSSDSSIRIEDRIVTSEKTATITWQLLTTAEVVINKAGAVLKQDGKELYLVNNSHPNIKALVVSLDPPPLKLDKKIENLKRIEIIIPVDNQKDQEINIQIELIGKTI